MQVVHQCRTQNISVNGASPCGNHLWVVRGDLLESKENATPLQNCIPISMKIISHGNDIDNNIRTASTRKFVVDKIYINSAGFVGWILSSLIYVIVSHMRLRLRYEISDSACEAKFSTSNTVPQNTIMVISASGDVIVPNYARPSVGVCWPGVDTNIFVKFHLSILLLILTTSLLTRSRETPQHLKC